MATVMNDREMARALRRVRPRPLSLERRRAALDLGVSFVIAILLLGLSMVTNYSDALHRHFASRNLTDPTPLIVNLLTVWLAGLLAIAFIRWRRSSWRTRELEAVLSSINPDTLLVINAQRTIIMCNDSVTRMFGYAPSEVVARQTDALYADRRVDPRQARRSVHDALEREGFHIGRAEGRHADGHTLPLEIITGHLKGGSGAVLLLRDISERLREGRERARLEERIARQEKMESLGVLAGGVAHDFNNILAGILGNADIVMGDLPETSPHAAHVQEIIRAANRAAVLCREMLAYAGKGLVQTVPLNLNEIIEDLRAFVTASLPPDVELDIVLEPEPSAVQGDPAQVRQILMNLIANGIDAMRGEPGLLRLTTETRDVDERELAASCFEECPTPGRFVCVTVADTGCGMDAATQQRIFEPFFTTKFTGHGLGMASVQGTIRGHRGALFLESEPGRGTTFRILLPAGETPAPPPRVPEPTGPWTPQGTVLVVDDEQPLIDICTRMLRSIGLQTLAATNGPDALHIARTSAPDLVAVVLDVTMPGMSGIDVFRELQRILPQVPVVLTSGYTEENVSQLFGARAPAGFIQKPFDRERLRATLREVMTRPTDDGTPPDDAGI